MHEGVQGKAAIIVAVVCTFNAFICHEDNVLWISVTAICSVWSEKNTIYIYIHRWPWSTPAAHSWRNHGWLSFFVVVTCLRREGETIQNFIYIEGTLLRGWIMIPHRKKANAEESIEAPSAALKLERTEVHTWLFHKYLNQFDLLTPLVFWKHSSPPQPMRSGPVVDVKEWDGGGRDAKTVKAL